MKIKRVFLIVLAGIFTFWMCVNLYELVDWINEGFKGFDSVGHYQILMSYTRTVASYLRSICFLAVVDFLFCVGQKRYSKSMLGICVAMFALDVMVIFVNSGLFGLTAYIHRITYEDPYTATGYFYLWTAHLTLPFVGLTIAYIVTKAKYLKSQSNHA